jgi:predicted DNA binding CopG/RHH family protein
MKPFRWGAEKNESLKSTRGVSFESIVVAVESEGLLDIVDHPNKAKYPNQKVLVVSFDGYVYLVPFVEDADHFFLKTVIPSRKATRDYLHKEIQMPDVDAYEREILTAFEKGKLKSVATKAELEKFRAAARATAVKDRRVNIRLSSIDLNDIQVRALEEGMPYQTLIASVLHKYVSGRLVEKTKLVTGRSTQTSRKRAAG